MVNTWMGSVASRSRAWRGVHDARVSRFVDRLTRREDFGAIRTFAHRLKYPPPTRATGVQCERLQVPGETTRSLSLSRTECVSPGPGAKLHVGEIDLGVLIARGSWPMSARAKYRSGPRWRRLRRTVRVPVGDPHFGA